MNKILNIHSHLNLEQRDDTIYSSIYPKTPSLSLRYCSSGIHPWYIPVKEDIDWDTFIHTVNQSNTLLVGECGLDTFSEIPLKKQIEVFEKQIQISESLKKPLLIHMVRTTDELLALHKHYQPRQPWIIHGFRGKPQLAKQYYKHGIYISTGIKFNIKTVQSIPLNKILLETDESEESIESLIQRIAKIKNISSQTLTEQIYKNTKALFFR